MIRVALLTWSYHPVTSGLARAAVEIAEGLVEAGAEVTVFAADRTGAERVGAVRVVGAAPTGALGWLRRRAAIGHLAAPLAFAGAVRRHGPFDVVEATNWYAPGLFVPRLVTRHSTPASQSACGGGLRDRLDHAAVRVLERLSACRSIGHISNMHHHGAAMAKLYRIPAPGRRHVAIPLAVPQPVRALAAAAATAEPPAPPRLVFVGRGTRRKGFDLLAGALNLLAAEKTPDFTVEMVGCGAAELDRLEPAARRLARTVIGLDDAGLGRLYGDATAVIAPSRYESFGLVYREALLFGTPVVALETEPSAAEFFAETPGGILVAEEPEALAAAIRPLISDGAAARAAWADAMEGGRRLLAGRRALGEATLAAYTRFGAGGPVRHSAAASPAE